MQERRISLVENWGFVLWDFEERKSSKFITD